MLETGRGVSRDEVQMLKTMLKDEGGKERKRNKNLVILNLN